ncbi:MAG: serine/threonine-protein kinase [Alloacidobacterium sp.]
METQKPQFIGDAPTIFEASGNGADADRTLATAVGVADASAGGARHHPVKIGRYRILRLVGEGGLGSVYQAEQENPHRIVTLKVIKPGFVNSELLRRFAQEAHALGRLQHPGIAQIYEAGTADSGFGPQPYFAMEYIEGRPLMEFAEERHLHLRARLELMAKICDAVNHAHQRGIIHRDLKPANILVDPEGQPRILDFGVARATDSDAEATRQTDLGQLIGTLAYMSPEQVQANTLELDIRSDVYALGVITYELLAGRLPYDTNRKALHEVVQAIQEVDPARLSSINRIYRGDIETIVAKALEKDKERRYASSAELAADIRRYLTDQPIVARPPSTIYQVQKFARRHRALVAGVAAVFLVLVAGVVLSTWQLVRARRAEAAAVQERDRAATAGRIATDRRYQAVTAEETARQERDRSVEAEKLATQERNAALTQRKRANSEAAAARAVNDFLENDLLAQASAANESGPATKPDPDLKVRTALDRAAAKITGKFDKQPEVEAAIRDTIGQTYLDLGLNPEARKQLELALALHQRVDGPDNPKTLVTARRLGVAALRQGKYAEAEALFNQNLEIRRRVIGPEHPLTLRCISFLAYTYSADGKYAQAEALFIQNLKAERRVLGPENRDTLVTLSDMAYMYQVQAKYGLAETYAAQALAGRRRLLGPNHPGTMATAADLARAYQSQGKFAESEPVAREVEAAEKTKQPDNWLRFWAESLLGASLAGEKKYAEAEPLLLEGYRGMLARKDLMSAPDRCHMDSAHAWIIRLYEAWGKPDKTAEWKQL